MGIKKVTGLKGADAVLAAFKKKNEDLVYGMGNAVESSETFPSGSVTLDAAIGSGGLPLDRMIEIFGPTSGGKTSLSLQFIAAWQRHETARALIEEREERIAAFFDLERTTDTDFMAGFGIDTEKVLYVRPNTAEQALQLSINLCKSGDIGCVVFDSVDAAQTEEDVKKDIDEISVATLPRKMSRATRELSKICTDSRVFFVFINQIRYKIGVMYGNPETTSGGNGLPYYASLRFRVKSKPASKTGDTLAMEVRVVKNKFAMQGKTAAMQFVCGRGVDPYLDLIECAKQKGIIRFAGSAVKDPETDLTICIGGRLGLKAHLEASPEEYEKLKSKCIGDLTILEETETTDEEED
jgi:recombination protein RecA